MLWAHNGHVTKKFPNYTSMGEYLKKIYNDKLYVIGFDFYQGSFRAIPCDSKVNYLSQKFAIFNVDKSDINSFAYSFEKTGIPLSFIDFKSASEDNNVAAWLLQPQLIHCIAEAYNSSFNQEMLSQVPIDSYDGLIFVKKTSAAIGIKGNETSINDGDSFIKNHNRNIYIATIASIIIIILAISVFIYRKIKSKNNI
jgi:erythromycin esterase